MSAVSANLYNCGSGTENTTFSCLYQEIVFDVLPAWIMGTDGLPWVGVMIGSILVGLSGILPLVLIPLGETDDLKQGGNYRIKNEVLFDVWLKANDKERKAAAIYDYILNLTAMPQQYHLKIRERARLFCLNLTLRWQKPHRKINNFRAKYADWLKAETIVEVVVASTSTTTSPLSSTSAKASASGRPRLPYSEKSLRSKRRDAAELAKEKQNESALIMQAASIAARQKGQKDLARVLKEVSKSPTRPTKIRKMFSVPHKDPIPYTPEEALAFLLDNNLSKQQYLNMRHGAKDKNCNIYPAYEKILESKSNCRPSELYISDSVAEIQLNKLLEHSVRRIVQLQEEPITSFITSIKNRVVNITAIFSYGFDGSSGQANYKQKFDTSGCPGLSDSMLFVTSVIPLRLVTTNDTILWNNKTPQSGKINFTYNTLYLINDKTYHTCLYELFVLKLSDEAPHIIF